MLSPQDVVPDSPPGSLLHGDPLSRGAFLQRRVLVFGQAKGHGHGMMIPD